MGSSVGRGMWMLDKFGLQRFQHPLPFGDYGGGDRIAENVGASPPHVEKLIDGQNNGNALNGKTEHCQGCGNDHDTGTVSNMAI